MKNILCSRVTTVLFFTALVVTSSVVVYLDGQIDYLQKENSRLQVEAEWAVEFSKLTDEQKEYIQEEIKKQTDL